jgi:hypothetical protein
MTLEEQIWELWHQSGTDSPIQQWATNVAEADYKFSKMGKSCPDKIINVCKQCDILIRNNLALALTSDAPYVRTYGELIIGERRGQKS